jgi:hypothetical protein
MLGVSVETYRTWNAGRRAASSETLVRAHTIVNAGQDVLVALQILAREFKVSGKTLRRAATGGRLRAQFKIGTYFGRPIALASRAAVHESLAHAFGRSPTALGCPFRKSALDSAYCRSPRLAESSPHRRDTANQ